MKKIICLLLCAIICLCCVSCEKKISTDNMDDYVFIEISFGEITHEFNTTKLTDETYYITCAATIIVKPRADYSFENASINLKLEIPAPWKIAHVASQMEKFSPDSFPSWQGTINLDKNGYGEKTIFLYCYCDYFEGVHPAKYKIEQEITSVSGTLKKN